MEPEPEDSFLKKSSSRDKETPFYEKDIWEDRLMLFINIIMAAFILGMALYYFAGLSAGTCIVIGFVSISFFCYLLSMPILRSVVLSIFSICNSFFYGSLVLFALDAFIFVHTDIVAIESVPICAVVYIIMFFVCYRCNKNGTKMYWQMDPVSWTSSRKVDQALFDYKTKKAHKKIDKAIAREEKAKRKKLGAIEQEQKENRKPEWI